MEMICEKCSKQAETSEMVFQYNDGKIACLCQACADVIQTEEPQNAEGKYETNSNQTYCTIINERKKEAESIIKNKNSFDKFLADIEAKLKTIPAVGNILADVPLLLSLVKCYVAGDYKEIPTGSIVAAVAALLYLIKPVDLIPDFIPVIGFTDDAAMVAFCVSSIHADLARFKSWRNKDEQEAHN